MPAKPAANLNRNGLRGSAAKNQGTDGPRATSRVNCLLDVGTHKPKPLPLSENLAWFGDTVETFVQGASYLLAGQPGSRKSGMALQIALDLADQGLRTLFILTEEPSGRLRDRAIQMTQNWSGARVRKALANIFAEDGLMDLELLPQFLAQQVLSPMGRYQGVGMVVLDSIQGQGISAAAGRKYKKLYESTRLCAGAGITQLLISHMTKRGQIAGPAGLEHHVDCALLLRRTMAYRMLFVIKNRFGPSVFRPLALELDPVTVALRASPHVSSLTSVARTYLGPGVGMAEVQAAVSLSSFGSRGRILAPGLPRKEIEQMVSCLGQIPGIEIDDLDFRIDCRLPGERRYRGTLGLPLCLALIASYVQRPIPPKQLHFGEIDLFRNVNPLPEPLQEMVIEALRNEVFERGTRILCSPVTADEFYGYPGIDVIACARLDDALFRTWPDLR